MYRYDKNHIEINGYGLNFKYDIRTVLPYKGKYIVLLGIPFDKSIINNVYCLDSNAKIIWRSEDLSVLYPNLNNLPYEQIGIEDGAIFALDFYGRNYKININSGKIERCSIVK